MIPNQNSHELRAAPLPRRPSTSRRSWARRAAACGLWIGATAGLLACSSESSGQGDRSLREGLTRMEALVGSGEYDDALAVADRLLAPDALSGLRTRLESWTRGASESLLGPVTSALDAFGIDAMTAEDRGEVQFARALVLLGSRAGLEGEPATERLDRARASLEDARRAGGGVALTAVEALGGLILAGAEAKRLEIPELGGGAPTGPVAPPPPASPPVGSGPSAMAAKDDSDPLEEARKLYLAARRRFVERLALEGRVDGGGDSEDARANAELITRRLRELDDIERQREEQKQQDDQQKSDQKSESDEENKDEKPPEDAEKDEQDESDGSDDSEPEDSEPQDESQEEDSEKNSEENGDESEDAEPPAPEEPESDASEEEAEPREVTEVELTAEEQQRLMDRNRAYQEEGDKRRRILLGRRRGNGKKDW